MTSPPSRQFDISWLEEAGVLTKAPEQATPTGEDLVLDAFRPHPDQRLHVVDIASATGLGFEDALQAVLRLAGQQRLEIVKRDEKADDHLVALMQLGREALERS